MAQIIPFPVVAKADRETRTDGCHVLIFPGVRIERERPAPAKATRRPPAKPRRKTQRPSKRTGT
jgi:hypothetical protein